MRRSHPPSLDQYNRRTACGVEQQSMRTRQRLIDKGPSIVDWSRTATEQKAADIARLNQCPMPAQFISGPTRS